MMFKRCAFVFMVVFSLSFLKAMEHTIEQIGSLPDVRKGRGAFESARILKHYETSTRLWKTGLWTGARRSGALL